MNKDHICQAVLKPTPRPTKLKNFSGHSSASELNPADVLSRGCKSDKRMKTKSWLSGPEFLSESPDSWPCRFGKTTLDVKNVKAFDKKATSAFLITEMIDPVDKAFLYLPNLCF